MGPGLLETARGLVCAVGASKDTGRPAFKEGSGQDGEGLIGKLVPLGREYAGRRCGQGVRCLNVFASRECHVKNDPEEAGKGGLLTTSGLEALGPWP